ncbi:heme-binding protein [Leifsonia sp. 2TAF2]|uniref:heme-binding protein n=1 Tax=Leifsonia sp. 2TAF2 TaxID=3233009 RepID=UPI003F9E6F17
MSDETFLSPMELLREEQSLVLQHVDEATCYSLGHHIAEVGLIKDQPLTISVRLGERSVFHAGLPGSTSLNDVVVTAKWNTARRSGHSSLYERNLWLDRGTTFEEATGLELPGYAAFGGAVPVWEAGTDAIQAFVIVSGLSQEEDHALAVSAIQTQATNIHAIQHRRRSEAR